MASVSYSTPTTDNGQAPNTLNVEGSGLPPNAAVTLAISATGSSGMTVSGSTDAEGAISASIAVDDPAIQALLPMIGQGIWNDSSTSWSVSTVSEGGAISMTCAVA